MVTEKERDNRTEDVTKQNLSLLTRHTGKPIYWHQIVVKESTAFIAGAKQGGWAAHAQKTQIP